MLNHNEILRRRRDNNTCDTLRFSVMYFLNGEAFRPLGDFCPDLFWDFGIVCLLSFGSDECQSAVKGT